MANPDPSPANRFRKGGAPGPGRPRGSVSLTDLLRKALKAKQVLDEPAPGGRRVAQWLVECMIKHAMDGRGVYMKEIMDRNDGPIPRPEPIAGADLDAMLDDLAAGGEDPPHSAEVP